VTSHESGRASGLATRAKAIWDQRSRRGKIAIAVVMGVLVLAVIGTAFPSEDTTSGDTTSTESSPVAPHTATSGGPDSSDSGRMSETEYEQFALAQSEVIDESLQFGEEVQKCSQIGLAGQVAEFSTCMDEAYSGFEEDVNLAGYIATDTLDDVADRCRAALNSYTTVLSDYAATVKAMHRAGSLLQFDRLAAASDALPGAAKRYSKFATNALSACNPS
jgi:hypothetical protein